MITPCKNTLVGYNVLCRYSAKDLGNHTMKTTLQWLQKHLLIAIPASMLLGFALGTLVYFTLLPIDLTPLQHLVLPATIFMIYPMMINFQPQKLFQQG
jgi:ACR3 family arsenite efflux pump ArsB